jgi:hypothetical protein
MAEFKRIELGSMAREERLEAGLRAVDPLFTVVWQAVLRKSAESYFVELGRQGALCAMIDRRGTVSGLRITGRIEEAAESFVERAIGYPLTARVVLFGELSGDWPRLAAESLGAGVYTASYEDVLCAAKGCADLYHDERIAVEQRTPEQVREVFGQLMDQALAAAVRAGCDADDVESDRLVRSLEGENGRWQMLEEWAREPNVRPVELRLRSIISRPAAILPDILEVQP